MTTVDEKKLKMEWPPLRSGLSVAVKGWRLKGLELLGTAVSLPKLKAVTVPPCPAEAEGAGRFDVPAAEAPEPILDIQGEDLTPFAGLPLFELV